MNIIIHSKIHLEYKCILVSVQSIGNYLLQRKTNRRKSQSVIIDDTECGCRRIIIGYRLSVMICLPYNLLRDLNTNTEGVQTIEPHGSLCANNTAAAPSILYFTLNKQCTYVHCMYYSSTTLIPKAKKEKRSLRASVFLFIYLCFCHKTMSNCSQRRRRVNLPTLNSNEP